MWWYKLETLTERDVELLPLGFTIKYGTFISKIWEMEKISRVESSRIFENRYEQVNSLDRLKTNSELAEI